MADNALIHSSGLFPAVNDRRVNKAMVRLEADAAVAKRIDALRIERVVEAAEKGMAAAGHIAAVEAVIAGMVPDAAPELRAIRQAGCVGIATVVLRAGS